MELKDIIGKTKLQKVKSASHFERWEPIPNHTEAEKHAPIMCSKNSLYFKWQDTDLE